MRSRLRYLVEVGLDYLTLDRQSRTLSGGELERVDLTTAVGSSLVNTLYVLDEPSIGLHPRDTERLVRLLHRLRDQGNTVVVVEHDPAIIRAADHVIDLGPGAGERGGDDAVRRAAVAALRAARGSRTADVPHRPARRSRCRRSGGGRIPGLTLGVRGARGAQPARHRRRHPARVLRARHRRLGLGQVDARRGRALPRRCGSGSASPTASPARAARSRAPSASPTSSSSTRADRLHAARQRRHLPARLRRHPRLLRRAPTRRACAATPPATFSFNVAGGRCETCARRGLRAGSRCSSSPTSTCRAPSATARASSAEVLEVALAAAARSATCSTSPSPRRSTFFADVPEVARARCGRWPTSGSTTSASASRCRRSRAARRSASSSPRTSGARRKAHTLFIFDEPTTGLHLADVEKLLGVLRAAGRARPLAARHRAQPRGREVRRLGHRPRPRGRRRRRPRRRRRARPRTSPRRPARTPAPFLARRRSHGAPTVRPIAEPARPPAPRDRVAASSASSAPASTTCATSTLELPRDQLIVFTGLSGSGKSSLAFDVLYAEGQRRYLDSLSTYARQFLHVMAQARRRPARRAAADGRDRAAPVAAAAASRRSRRSPRSPTTCACSSPSSACSTARAAASRSAPQTRAPDPRPHRGASSRGEHVTLLAPVGPRPQGLSTRRCLPAARKLGFARRASTASCVALGRRAGLLDRYQEHDIDLVVGSVDLGGRAAALDDELVAARCGSAAASVVVAGGRRASGSTRERLFCAPLRHRLRRRSIRACSRSTAARARARTATGSGVRVEPDRRRCSSPTATARRRRRSPALERPGAPRREARSCAGADARRRAAAIARSASSTAAQRTRVLDGDGSARPARRAARAALERRATPTALDGLPRRASRAPACDGTRLNPRARAVRVHGPRHRRPRRAARRRCGDAPSPRCASARASGRSPRDRCARSCRACAFLEQVGLGYLDARPPRRHALGRRGAAHPARGAARLEPARRLLRPRRADDRPAPARQRHAARRARGAARARQHGARRRARRGDDRGAPTWSSTSAPAAARTAAASSRSARRRSSRRIRRRSPAASSPPARSRVAPARDRSSGALARRARRARAQPAATSTSRIPLGAWTCVTGVSGSGKSTLVRDVLYRGVRRALGLPAGRVGAHRAHRRASSTSSAPSRSTRRRSAARRARRRRRTSASATTSAASSRMTARGARCAATRAGRFSFNVAGGRCEACAGQGRHQDGDELPARRLRRLRRRAAGGASPRRRWRSATPGRRIARGARDDGRGGGRRASRRTRPIARAAARAATTSASATSRSASRSNTLSGGEAQRIKLAYELGKESRGRDALRPRRADHRPALRRHRAADRRAAPPGRPRQHRRHHRAQPRHRARGRLDHRPRPRGRRGRRPPGGLGPPDQVARCETSHTGRFLRELSSAA